ncbi:MAG: carboxypeptidase-like regulatory domain-containing protein, partial [Candidatus Binatia bacterium]
MKRPGLLCWLVAAVLAVAAAVQAQTTATISGTVKDESGSVLPGVSVTVTELGTAAARTVVSEHDGRFRAPQLPIGNYEVKAELVGFQTTI